MNIHNGSGGFVEIPIDFDVKYYIKGLKRARKQGCSFDEFLASLFLPQGVDAIPSNARTRKAKRTAIPSI